MRLLVLPRYNRLGASSRLRMMQYFPCFESAGIDVTVAPLFSDAYVLGLQQSKLNIGEIFQAYVQRVKTLFLSGKYDLIWIEKELLPWLPAEIELALLSRRTPYALDYDDAVFHYYDLHRNSVVRSLLAAKHSKLIENSALVVAGNTYLADYARHAGAKRVEVIPTAIDLLRYPQQSHVFERSPSSPPCVGWIGQRATAEYLTAYTEIFNRLFSEGRATFYAIGINAQAHWLPMNSIPWSEQTEVANIASFDIGIMPLVDDPFERGKCGYKLIQYMACGLPVVASPVGVNCQIVEHGVNGFLADTTEEWERSLKMLLADKELRRRMGLAGRRKVEREFCIQITGPRLAVLLKDAVMVNNIVK